MMPSRLPKYQVFLAKNLVTHECVTRPFVSFVSFANEPSIWKILWWGREYRGMATEFWKHCNIMQHSATHCNALEYTVEEEVWQCTCETYCNALQQTSSHYNTVQHTVTHWRSGGIAVDLWIILQGNAKCCHTLPHTATHYHTRQHTATHCNTLKKRRNGSRLVKNASRLINQETEKRANAHTHTYTPTYRHTDTQFYKPYILLQTDQQTNAYRQTHAYLQTYNPTNLQPYNSTFLQPYSTTPNLYLQTYNPWILTTLTCNANRKGHSAWV